jgi:hypothetical protein
VIARLATEEPVALRTARAFAIMNRVVWRSLRRATVISCGARPAATHGSSIADAFGRFG